MIPLPAVLKPALLTAALCGSAFLLTACGGNSPERSVAAYCSYFYGEGERLRVNQSNVNTENPISGMASVLGDIPETADFLHNLALRAPEEISPEVESLADALDHLSENMGSAASDPFGALAGGLMEGLVASGAEQRVNAYTLEHCGPPPSG